MKIIVGSTSIRKIEIVKKTLQEITKQNFEVIGIKADSLMPEIPWDKQTFDGARNRAMFCKSSGQEAEYYLGLESGLVNRYGHVYEEAWAVVINSDGEEFAGYSSGLKVPDLILKKMEKHNVSHNEVMNMLDAQKSVLLKHETWGNYTAGLLLRKTSLAESLRNALLQIFSPEESFYKQ